MKDSEQHLIVTLLVSIYILPVRPATTCKTQENKTAVWFFQDKILLPHYPTPTY